MVVWELALGSEGNRGGFPWDHVLFGDPDIPGGWSG